MPILTEFRNHWKLSTVSIPGNSDTDGDGFSDGEELAAMTNPKSPESNPGEMAGPALAVARVAGGVAGLVSGAGAGSAAGLVSGRVSHPLGGVVNQARVSLVTVVVTLTASVVAIGIGILITCPKTAISTS